MPVQSDLKALVLGFIGFSFVRLIEIHIRSVRVRVCVCVYVCVA